ncbi:MAG: TraB/GumN family protein [Rhizobacter sp.]
MSLSIRKQVQSMCAAALTATAAIVALPGQADASGSVHQDGTQPLTPANYVYRVVSAQGHTAYVFGSSHLSPSNAPVQLGICTKKLLAASATVVIEADPASSRQYMDGRPSTLPMSQVLPLLTDTQMQELHQWVYGVTTHNPDTRLAPLDAFEVIKHLSARQTRLRQALVGWSDHGLDTEIMMAARFLGKTTASLETPQEQFAFFRSMTAPMHAQQIGAALATLSSRDELNQSGHMLLKLVRYAALGDEEALLESIGMLGDSGDYLEATVFKRNASQAEKVDQLIQSAAQKPIFFALGALHLAGEGGVPARLGAKGYEVRRVCVD